MQTRRSKKRQAHRERLRQQKPPYLGPLRVMAEYGSSGIWVIGQVGVFRHGMIEHGDLRLPGEVAERFGRWIAAYEDRLEDPPPPPFDYGAFNREGRALAEALKRHVGAGTYVEFLPETDEGTGLGPPEEIG
jgi:hypothetical protein